MVGFAMACSIGKDLFKKDRERDQIKGETISSARV